MSVLLAGCAPTEDELAAQHAEEIENRWAASGNDGPPPDVSERAIRSVVFAITARAETVLIEGSTEEDCEAFGEAFHPIVLAEFDNSRDDYLAPLANSLSQITSGCEDRGTWEGTIDDVIAVQELGTEYLDRF